MARILFTRNLQRHLECPSEVHVGETVKEVLDAYFAQHPLVRGYVLDDQGAVRRHMAIFVDAAEICDRVGLSDPVAAEAEVYVMQALSGG
jgi:molybdopterin converting factor small subunit